MTFRLFDMLTLLTFFDLLTFWSFDPSTFLLFWPPDHFCQVIPGRMTLLITIFLVLINIFNTIQTNSPQVFISFSNIHIYTLTCNGFQKTRAITCKVSSSGNYEFCAILNHLYKFYVKLASIHENSRLFSLPNTKLTFVHISCKSCVTVLFIETLLQDDKLK